MPEFDSLFQVSFLSENWKKLKVVRVFFTDGNKKCLGNCSFFQFQYLSKYCKLKPGHNQNCYNLQIRFTLTKTILTLFLFYGLILMLSHQFFPILSLQISILTPVFFMAKICIVYFNPILFQAPKKYLEMVHVFVIKHHKNMHSLLKSYFIPGTQKVFRNGICICDKTSLYSILYYSSI